jgi:opacity protein-like surface antigen
LDWDIKVETKDLADLRRRVEKRRVGIMLESGMMLEGFQLVSDSLSISQQYATTIPFGGRAYWWFLPYLGIEGYYTYAKWDAKTGFNNQEVSSTLQWFGGDLKLRYAFGRTIRSPVVWIQAGYNFFKTDIDSITNPVIRLSDSYEYMDVGVGTKIPFVNRVGFQGDFRFFPYIDLDESPLTSGRTGNTKGFQLDGGIYYNFWKDFSAELNYRFIFFDNDFTGRATRFNSLGIPLSLVQTRAIYHGLLLGLKYEF